MSMLNEITCDICLSVADVHAEGTWAQKRAQVMAQTGYRRLTGSQWFCTKCYQKRLRSFSNDDDGYGMCRCGTCNAVAILFRRYG